MFLKLVLISIVFIGLAFLGVAIKMFFKKNYTFKKQCSSVDPDTGKHSAAHAAVRETEAAGTKP